MLKGKLVTLRSIEREDLPVLATFHNDLEVEVLGGGNAPVPQSLAALQAQFDENVKEGRRTQFVIEADGKVIGECGCVTSTMRTSTASSASASATASTGAAATGAKPS